MTSGVTATASVGSGWAWTSGPRMPWEVSVAQNPPKLAAVVSLFVLTRLANFTTPRNSANCADIPGVTLSGSVIGIMSWPINESRSSTPARPRARSRSMRAGSMAISGITTVAFQGNSTSSASVTGARTRGGLSVRSRQDRK